MTEEGEYWMWTSDPRAIDEKWAAYFEEWFDTAKKDSDGFYSEQLPVDTQERLSPDKRTDGSLSMLPMFFSQILIRERKDGGRIPSRGPTVEQFLAILARLQDLLPAFEFIVQQDPERQWIRYRVRR